MAARIKNKINKMMDDDDDDHLEVVAVDWLFSGRKEVMMEDDDDWDIAGV
jgi:hypothetical protein